MENMQWYPYLALAILKGKRAGLAILNLPDAEEAIAFFLGVREADRRWSPQIDVSRCVPRVVSQIRWPWKPRLVNEIVWAYNMNSNR